MGLREFLFLCGLTSLMSPDKKFNGNLNLEVENMLNFGTLCTKAGSRRT
jgi:hypothetical protein